MAKSLEQAIKMVLLSRPSSARVPVAEIARLINEHQLFRKRGGLPVLPSDVAMSAASHMAKSDPPTLDITVSLKPQRASFYMDGKETSVSMIKEQTRAEKHEPKGDKPKAPPAGQTSHDALWPGS